MSYMEIMVNENSTIMDLIIAIKATYNPDVLNKIEQLPQSRNEDVIAELDWKWKVIEAQKYPGPARVMKKQTK